MATCSAGTTCCVLITLVFLFLTVGLPILLAFTGSSPNYPTFTVESTSVKAYNLTADDRLFCIINIRLRAHNPNPTKYSYSLYGIDMEVRKGKHHALANDALLGFDIGPDNDVIVDVEAVGLRLGLKRKIAKEVRADAAAGEGRVNVFMSGQIGSDDLHVTCKNVVVDFSGRSMVRVQKVNCGVNVKSNDDDN